MSRKNWWKKSDQQGSERGKGDRRKSGRLSLEELEPRLAPAGLSTLWPESVPLNLVTVLPDGEHDTHPRADYELPAEAQCNHVLHVAPPTELLGALDAAGLDVHGLN